MNLRITAHIFILIGSRYRLNNAGTVAHHKTEWRLTLPGQTAQNHPDYSQNINQDDAVIDIGCGKGGMLKIFSDYRFGEVAGLDFLKELCDIANENMRALNIDVKIINADAVEYDDYDRYNYIYMYNPFGKEIMEKVVSNLSKSLTRNPREMHVIYANPVHGNLFLANGFKVEKKFKMSLMFSEQAIIYRKNVSV